MHNKHKSDYNPDYISPWMTNHEEQRHLSKSFATHWSGNLPVNPHPKTSLYKIKPKHKA